MIFSLWTVVLVMMLTSCVTTSVLEDLVLPITVDGRFQSCSGMDGVSLLDIKRDAEFKGSIEVEWVGESNGNLMVEGLSPLGQPLVRFSYERATRQIKVIDRLGIIGSNEIATNESGFLTFNNNDLPIHIHEVACFLEGAFPRKWLDRVIDKQEEPSSISLSMEDNMRYINVVLHKSPRDKKSLECALITWRPVFFVKRSLNLCLSQSGNGSIDMGSDNQISWKRINE